MNTDAMNDNQTIREALLEQLALWVAELKLGENEKVDFHIGKPHKIDPENGKLTQAFVIEAHRQMERVNEPSAPVSPLPPIPPAQAVS